MSGTSTMAKVRAEAEELKKNFEEYKSGSWGNPLWLLAGVVVFSLVMTLIIWLLHKDVFESPNGVFRDMSFFAAAGGFPFFFCFFLAAVGGTLAISLSIGKNMTSMIVAAVCLIAMTLFVWLAIRDVKNNGSNANSFFHVWASLLVIVAVVFPIVGIVKMHMKMTDLKKAGNDALIPKDNKETLEMVEHHDVWVKGAGAFGLIGALGLGIATAKMWGIIHP